jgi:hypothetical protein
MLHSLPRRGFLTFLTATLAFADFSGPSGQKTGRVPEQGMVPNAETAQSIASAITLVHFGEETLKLSQPWKTHLAGNDQIWIVSGLRIPNEQGLGIVVHISRHNGCISYLDRTR